MESQGGEELVVYAGDLSADINELKIDMAFAHVSAQTQDIADYLVQLHANQQMQAQQMQLSTEARVQQARVEAETRTEALAEMIRATRIDPAALEHHVNSKLETAILVPNDVAQTQARAVAEAHTAQHAQVSDIRKAEAFKHLETQLHTSVDQRMRKVLTAHMEQVGAEIRLAIAKQDQEILKFVECQIDDLQKNTTAQIEFAKSCAERKAKSIVRRHQAEENSANESIRASLLDAMAVCKASAVATPAQRAEERFQALVTQQEAAIADAHNSTRGRISPNSRSYAWQDTARAGTFDVVDDESSTLSEEQMQSPPGTPEEYSSIEVNEQVLAVLKMLRVANARPKTKPITNPDLNDARKAEQSKVAARALTRSRTLVDNVKKPVRSVKTPSSRQKLASAAKLTTNEQIQIAVKRRSDEREIEKKKRAEDVMKLAELLLNNTA